MATRYEVRLKSLAGAYTAVFDYIPQLSYELRLNDFATHTFSLPGDDDRVPLFVLDSQLEVWRKPTNGSWYRDYEGFHRTGTESTLVDGRKVFTSYGRGYEDLLNRRIIIGYKGTSYTEKNDVAETVMKEFVSEQCTAGAIFRIVTGLSVQADAASGNNISVQAGWANLLETLTKYAWETGGVDFAVVGTGPATFEFRVYDGIRGADHTVGNAGGNPAIIFDETLQNLRLPTLSTARTAEVTAYYVGGAGSLSTRPVREVTDAAAIALSTWNRIEGFKDGGNVTDNGVLDDIGAVELIKNEAKRKFDFEIVQSGSYKYGDDYVLGDLVTVRRGSTDYDKQIASVEITVNGSGEKVVPKVIDRVV